MLERLPDFAKVTPRDFNRVADALDRLTLTSSPPIQVSHQGDGTQLLFSRRGFVAQITTRTDTGSSPRWRYTLTKVFPRPVTDNSGLWALLSGETVVAYEYGDEAVSVGRVVSVYPWGDTDYRFRFCSGGG